MTEAAAPDRPLRGILFISAAVLGFVCMDVLIKAATAHLPVLLEASGATPAAAIVAAALVGPAQVAARLLEFGVLARFSPLVSARLATIGNPLGAAVLLAFGGVAAPAFAILHGMGNGILTIAKGTLPLHVFGPVGYGARQNAAP